MQKLNIDPATWETLNRLLDEALDRAPEDIEPWIASLPADVAPLLPKLRELLARSGAIETGEFLENLPKLDLAPGDLAQPGAEEVPGTLVGPYRLVRELGSGGMGVVWLAERSDGLVNRPVALKLPHGAWRRAGLPERMAREREILAALNHPNIAHLYDAGVTANGQPWLAIEYIEGERIDAWCRRLELGARARLALFTQVAAAVAYAHGKLVVHRDLKPANILVDATGRARLLDFGIAKLLDEGTARESHLTEMSGRALTPDYASPEQILGLPLTIASDVYSLGVVLYELLCGERPYTLKRDSRGALEDAILQSEPAPRPELRGDLDTIVLKALRKDPAHRYPTAHALLDDIERFLQSRPVLAQPDSRWYRARKFVARNRVAAGAGAAIVCAVLAGAGVSVWQARVAVAERDRAQEVQDFIAAIFREADPMQGKGKSLTAAELLLQAERRLRERTDASPALRAQMLAIMGESLFGLQDLKEAARILEEAARVQASAPSDPPLAAGIQLALSQSYEYLGRNDDAMAQLEGCFATLRGARLERSTLFVRAKLHESAMGLATQDYAGAERAGNEAFEAASRIVGPRSIEAATALQLVSKAYLFTIPGPSGVREANRAPQAVERSKQALDLMLENHGGDYSHPRVIESAQYYANALIHVGDLETAAGLMRNVIARAEQALGAESRMVGELLALAVPAELERGNLPPAIEMARRSVTIYLRDSEPGTTVHAYRLRLLGAALLAARLPDATARLEEAVRVSAQAFGPNAPPYGSGSYGLALARRGEFAAAQAQIDRSLAGSPAKSRAMHQAMRNQGTLLRLQGRPADAVPWFEKAIVAANRDAFDRSDRAISFTELGLARLQLGSTAAADDAFAKSGALFAALQGSFMTPARVDLLVGLGRAHLARGEFALALPLLAQADTYWRDAGPRTRWAGEAALWYGRCLVAQDREREGRIELERAARLLAASPLPADTELVRLARRR